MVNFTGLRASPVPGPDVGQPTAAAANPSNPPSGNARDKREIGHITSYDRPGCDERPAPDDTTRYDHGTRTQRSALPHHHAKSVPILRALELAGDIHRRGYRSLVSTAAGPMNTSSSRVAGS